MRSSRISTTARFRSTELGANGAVRVKASAPVSRGSNWMTTCQAPVLFMDEKWMKRDETWMKTQGFFGFYVIGGYFGMWTCGASTTKGPPLNRRRSPAHHLSVQHFSHVKLEKCSSRKSRGILFSLDTQSRRNCFGSPGVFCTSTRVKGATCEGSGGGSVGSWVTTDSGTGSWKLGILDPGI